MHNPNKMGVLGYKAIATNGSLLILYCSVLTAKGIITKGYKLAPSVGCKYKIISHVNVQHEGGKVVSSYIYGSYFYCTQRKNKLNKSKYFTVSEPKHFYFSLMAFDLYFKEVEVVGLYFTDSLSQ